MRQRLLVVTDDALEWQALNRQLGDQLDLVRANGRDQALATLDRDGDVTAVVAYWGALSSGPELMQAVSARKPKVVRVLISERPGAGEAQALIAQGVVRTVVSSPAGLPSALGAAGPVSQQPAVRAEQRSPIKVQLHVSTPAWEGFIPLFTRDASRGGAFFSYAQRVVPTSGAPCTVKTGPSAVAGVVAHVVTARLATATGVDAGFGVSFTTLQPVDWWAPLLAPQAAPAAPVPSPSPSPSPRSGAAPTAKELESAKNFYNLGMSFYDERNYGAARQKFELAARCAPDARYEAMQAVCSAQQYLRSNLADKARETLERALQLDGNCAPAVTALGALKRQKR